MATLDEFIDKVREIAEREHRQPEEILATMLHDYETSQQEAKLTEVDEEIRAFRRKMYAKARDYWRKAGDEERLKLSDGALDEQFWLFDNDGIPRLKSDEGKFELKPDPLEGLVGLFSSGLGDLSTSVRETLEKSTHPKYGWTKSGRTD